MYSVYHDYSIQTMSHLRDNLNGMNGSYMECRHIFRYSGDSLLCTAGVNKHWYSPLIYA